MDKFLGRAAPTDSSKNKPLASGIIYINTSSSTGPTQDKEMKDLTAHSKPKFTPWVEK